MSLFYKKNVLYLQALIYFLIFSNMKKFLLVVFSLFLFNSTFAVVEDTSVIDELNNKNTTELKFDFKLKKFESCEDMSSVLTNFIKKYYNDRPTYYR